MLIVHVFSALKDFVRNTYSNVITEAQFQYFRLTITRQEYKNSKTITRQEYKNSKIARRFRLISNGGEQSNAGVRSIGSKQ